MTSDMPRPYKPYTLCLPTVSREEAIQIKNKIESYLPVKFAWHIRPRLPDGSLGPREEIEDDE
jgi:hypothetical protein